jgi:transcriptional regulator with XRE-family HTH domain
MSCMRDQREARHMTQRELAEVTGLSAVSISRYETGARTLSVANAKVIASALNTEWMSFFEDSDHESEGVECI